MIVMKSTKFESQEVEWVILNEIIPVASHLRYWPLCKNHCGSPQNGNADRVGHT